MRYGEFVRSECTCHLSVFSGEIKAGDHFVRDNGPTPLLGWLFNVSTLLRHWDIQTNMNPGVIVKRFCKCAWSPSSVDFKCIKREIPFGGPALQVAVCSHWVSACLWSSLLLPLLWLNPRGYNYLRVAYNFANLSVFLFFVFSFMSWGFVRMCDHIYGFTGTE